MAEDEVPDEVMRVWLEACDCCPWCNQSPCQGVMAGGLCDAMPCRCDEDQEPYGFEPDDDEEL